MISIIVAMSPNHAIGYKGALPWHIPEDLARFKRLTMGHTIIMGRHTFESLPHGALPGRRNIVLSRSHSNFPSAEVFPSLKEALQSVDDGDENFIIGGAEVYRQALPLAGTLYITLIDENPPLADTFFPAFNAQNYIEIEREKHPDFTFVTLLKKQAPSPVK